MDVFAIKVNYHWEVFIIFNFLTNLYLLVLQVFKSTGGVSEKCHFITSRTKTHSSYFLKWKESCISLMANTVTLPSSKLLNSLSRDGLCRGASLRTVTNTPANGSANLYSSSLPHIPWCYRLSRGTVKWEWKGGKKTYSIIIFQLNAV